MTAQFSEALRRIAGSGSGYNLAPVATSTTSYVSPHETIKALNDDFIPAYSNDKSHGAYGNWPRNGMQWTEYCWEKPVSLNKMDVYWFDDQNGVRLPVQCRVKYWDGSAYVSVPNPIGLGLLANQFNTTTFDEITTTKLRLEFDSNGTFSTGILDWKVYDSGKSPNFPPVVHADLDRVVVLPDKTKLRGYVTDDGKPSACKIEWSKASGPGSVKFSAPGSAETTASFTSPGKYVLKLTANDGEFAASRTVEVLVDKKPGFAHLDPIYVNSYKISSPFWKDRIKGLIVNWVPHCIKTISDPVLPEGGISNFVEAGNKLAGRSYKPHVGAYFSNAWVHNIIESMCAVMTVDPQGDEEIIASQKTIRQQLEEWIPVILSAQEPDGYLQTYFTLGGHKRWTDQSAHEGYNAGYFIDAALAHYVMTGKSDKRMYNAAIKLADCWVNNIGPAPKKTWFDGHQELEQALVRLASFVSEDEGAGAGRKYIELAKFLIESRKGGSAYDQSYVPIYEQYEAVGHAVRAVYFYSGVAGVAMETGDIGLQSAVKSIWSNLINKKYYVTGGVGSGETSEGFGGDYSLPNNAYCESCSGCGELFFQHNMNLMFHDSKYVDLYEETLYNAILSDVDLDGKNFTYTNSLDSSESRYLWHGCPCCVGNIPRTLLMLPTWMYSKSADSIYVNLFVGSTVMLKNAAGTDVQIIQETEYPWKNQVAIMVNPNSEKRFSIKIRIPNRNVSSLYTTTPPNTAAQNYTVNGKSVKASVDNGYAVITRTWKPGDKIEFTLPMSIQRVKADPKVAADLGKVALRYGPLVYNFESVDQNIDQVLSPTSTLSTEWAPDLLGGVMVIKGSFANGASFQAIPNYARNNRGGRSVVWMNDK